MDWKEGRGGKEREGGGGMKSYEEGEKEEEGGGMKRYDEGEEGRGKED